jgi:hypothetical protein
VIQIPIRHNLLGYSYSGILVAKNKNDKATIMTNQLLILLLRCIVFYVTILWTSTYHNVIDAYHVVTTFKRSSMTRCDSAPRIELPVFVMNQNHLIANSDILIPENNLYSKVICDRRSFVFSTAIGSTVAFTPIYSSANADTGAEVRGTSINAFNGLAFQYRGSDFNGLSASDIDEPSISYQEFVSKLKSNDVTMVEFYAPDGDVAYATLKSTKNRIRIGEGYPTEQHDGFSSPTFAIRTVSIPYKFIVPAIAKSK